MTDWLSGLSDPEREHEIDKAVRQQQLKVKIKTLAAEAAIIRQMERKTHFLPAKSSLHEHRVIPVRREQRAALLAYGLIRGRSYREIERYCHCDDPDPCKEGPSWKRVEGIVSRFGTKDQAKMVGYWRRQP